MQTVEWNSNLDKKYICLYVGKSTNLLKRLRLHKMIKTENIYSDIRNPEKINKKTTSCQFRAGFDFLFNGGKDDTRTLIKNYVYYTFCAEPDFAERFYMEDYLIGKLRPWFNIDSER